MKKRNWKNEDSTALFHAITKLKSVNECQRFFRDLCTHEELEEMATRFKIARELASKERKSYAVIAKETSTSTATVTRVAQWLHGGMGGYRLMLERLK